MQYIMYYMHKVVNKVLNGFHLQTENGDYQDDEVFTNFFVVTISQCVCVSKHNIVNFKCTKYMSIISQ